MDHYPKHTGTPVRHLQTSKHLEEPFLVSSATETISVIFFLIPSILGVPESAEEREQRGEQKTRVYNI